MLWQQQTQLNSMKKFRKKKLWAEMLVNIQDIPLNNIKDIPQFHIPELQLDLNLDVNRNVIGVTFSNDKFVTGGVHECNWLLNCCLFHQ